MNTASNPIPPEGRCQVCGKRRMNCKGHIVQINSYKPIDEAEWHRQYDNAYCYDYDENGKHWK